MQRRFAQLEIDAERKAQSDAQLIAEQKVQAAAKASEDKIKFLEMQSKCEVFTHEANARCKNIADEKR